MNESGPPAVPSVRPPGPGRGGSAPRADVLVVGAGLIGAAAALGLADAGLRVGWIAAADHPAPDPAPAPGSVADRTEPDVWDSRIYAVSPASIAWLTRIGVWAGVDRDRVCPVSAMQISGDDGSAQLVFDSRTARSPQLAAICESRNLARGIERALAAAGGIGERLTRIDGRVIDVRVGDRLASVGLASGATLRAPLVVAADGVDSVVREQAGIAVRRHEYRHTGVVANFRCSTPHRDVARQWFFGDAVLALLPLPGDCRSLVWSCSDEQAAYLLELSPADLAAEVARVTAGEAGAIEALTPAHGFPLRLQQVAQLVAPRVALVGDAAHAVHPLAGQGMNLGFGDCRDLVSVLAARGPQTDVGDLALLQRYQRLRAEPIAAMRLATDGLFRLFASDLPGVAWLRNFGLGRVDRVPALKRQLIAAAMN